MAATTQSRVAQQDWMSYQRDRSDVDHEWRLFDAQVWWQPPDNVIVGAGKPA